MAIHTTNRADLLQVLVLTHEQEPTPSMQAYAAVRLWPAQPVLLYGRSAAETPVCDKKTAVFHGWKDRLEQHNCDRAFDLDGTSFSAVWHLKGSVSTSSHCRAIRLHVMPLRAMRLGVRIHGCTNLHLSFSRHHRLRFHCLDSFIVSHSPNEPGAVVFPYLGIYVFHESSRPHGLITIMARITCCRTRRTRATLQIRCSWFWKPIGGATREKTHRSRGQVVVWAVTLVTRAAAHRAPAPHWRRVLHGGTTPAL